MIMTLWSSFVRKWRKWKNSPDGLFQALILTIIIGVILYICSILYQRQIYRERLEIDYYDDAIHKSKRKGVEIKAFEPNLFKEFDHPGMLMGVSGFKFSLNVPNPSSWCRPNKSNKIRMLLVIVSSPMRHEEHRKLIRSTWGSLQRIRDWEVKVVFMIKRARKDEQGQANEVSDSQMQDEEEGIKAEAEAYKDIVFGNFEDEKPSEYRLSQHLMSYKWALTYCSNAHFILRTMDTTFVDMFQVMEKINYAIPRNTLICGLSTDMETMRFRKRKGKSVMPTANYCNPYAMIMSMDVAEKIYFLTNDNDRRSRDKSGDSSRRRRTGPGTKTLPFIEEGSIQNKLTGMEMRAALDVEGTNVAHKFLYSTDSAFKWARNGKFTRDQKPPWSFLILPNGLPSDMSKSVRKLWRKIVIVNALVFEFKLLPQVRIGEKDFKTISSNMKSAVVKLKDL